MDSTKRLARCFLRFSNFAFNVIHRSGVEQKASNALSRLRTTNENSTSLENDFPLLTTNAEHDRTRILTITDNGNKIVLVNVQEERSVDTPPTLKVLVAKHAPDEYCKPKSLNISHAESKVRIFHRSLLTQRSTAKKSTQNVASVKLRALILYLAHHLPISGHTGQRWMYDVLRCTSCCQHMASDVYTTLANARAAYKTKAITMISDDYTSSQHGGLSTS